MGYVPLWCKSNYSFLEGASHPKELVRAAHAHGLTALALTDRDGVYGLVQAHQEAKALGLRLISGAQITVDDGRAEGSRIVLLAQTRAGYAGLCHLITTGRLRSEKGQSSVTWAEVCGHAEGLIALWGGAGSLLAAEDAPTRIAGELAEAFGDRLYALLTRHRRAEEVAAEARLRERARRHGLPLLAATEVLYHDRQRRPLQDVLTCIRHGVTLHEAGRRIAPNAGHTLRSPRAFAALYADEPAAVARTAELAQRCRFSLDEIRYRYPAEWLPEGLSSMDWLRRLTLEGARRRYAGEPPADVLAQIGKELALIEELDYPGYFLTMWEIVSFCRRTGILCQGRGSAANSAVCYCLGITAVDPVRMNLLFERFLSRERAEPPDIDLDIEHHRREEAIQFVYEKYGRERAAMVANVIRYRAKSAARDVGKVLGLAETALSRLGNLLSHGHLNEEMLRTTGLAPQARATQHFVRLVAEIQDFPRHLSIHPGGFLLGHEPVHSLVPIENATMEKRTVIQWDKDDLEAIGLFKVDLLGLGALHQIHLCLDLMRQCGQHRRADGTELTLATIPADDPATYQMMCRADTVGVFQIESRAQMAMLPRLRPRTFYDLVVEISIVRPGPITGGMVHPYLRRRNKEEPVTYPHPRLEKVLEKTLGIPLFQEQVMKLAMEVADYTPGEADQLRRDMAAWRRTGQIEKHREPLVGRMMKNGIEREFAERVFKQIEGFGDYGFPESHAASFALIAYATSWLKCHHPEAFACSLLNAQPMGFYSAATLVEDAKRHGVLVRPIDVRHSGWDCSLEDVTATRPALRMGLRYVKGLREDHGRRVEAERAAGPYADLADFCTRTRLDEKGLLALATAGSFEGLGLTRREALWQVRGLLRLPATGLPLPSAEETPAFAPLDRFDTIAWDRGSSSHSARGHPLGPLRPQLTTQGLPDARTLNQMPGGRRVRYAGVVLNRQRPSTANGVVFLTLEDETGFVNLVVWENVFAQYWVIAKTASFLGVTGKLQVQDGVVHLIVEELWHPELQRIPERQPSRDFH